MVNDIFKIDDGLFEHNGELYYEEIKEKDEILNEENSLEYADVPTFRRIVGTGSIDDDFDDNGFLADRRDKRVYKKVINFDGVERDYIVYSVEDGCNYCIRNGCFDCELADTCNVEVVVKNT